MAGSRWLLALGASLVLSSPAWAAVGTAENLDFRLSVESISWTASGFVVKAAIENRTGSPDLFLHHAANQDDPEAYVYSPEADAQGARRTFTLKGLNEARTAATLAFGVGPDEQAGLLVVGEARPPYRHLAIALKPLLPPRPVAQRPAALPPAAQPAASPQATPGVPEAAADPDVIQRFLPPHPSFGDFILLKEGRPGPDGEGWVRIYTDLPDITLTELKRVVESPAQIWQGPDGYLYLRNVGGKRALAVEVRQSRIISARYVTPESLNQVVGPRTRFPKRAYMGRP